MHAIGRIALRGGGRALALAAAFLLAVPLALADTPEPPTLTSVTAENGEATLNWAYAYSPGSFQWRGQKNDEDWTAWAGGVLGGLINGTARSHAVSNIQSGNTYTFQIRAVFVQQDRSFRVVTTYTDPSNSMSVTVADE